ncbi:MAG: hypothetical protein PUJ34_06675 [Subdoligranulum sp.]|nr:hypothetical protein [Subdoligranulum sp.]
MAFTKITDEDLLNKGVIGLPDTPGLSTSEMQAKFEQTAREVIIPMFNQLVDDLSNPSAASQIGANGKNRTVQGHIDNLENPHNVTAAQVGAYTKSQTDAAISDRISQIGSADMTQAMYDPTGKQQDIFAYADSLGVNTYTHTKMDNVHHFSGSGTSGRVKMTADVESGDTVMLNGEEVPAYVGAETFADALAGEPVTGRWLTFTQDGTQINFNGGGGLSIAKLALATADTGDVISGKKFYSGDKTIKTGAILPRNTVGENGAVGLSQFLTGVAVSKANSKNTQTNNNLDRVSRLCLQPPAGFYNGNTYVGETFENVASAIGLNDGNLCAGDKVLGITGSGHAVAMFATIGENRWSGGSPNRLKLAYTVGGTSGFSGFGCWLPAGTYRACGAVANLNNCYIADAGSLGTRIYGSEREYGGSQWGASGTFTLNGSQWISVTSGNSDYTEMAVVTVYRV